ncbi:MAG: hypothetical protein PHX18_02425 [Candidatus Gastranaerophilales bacterium]|nr:hypothetical protein [Candidatus Gastranaerophilales bacterium]
MNEPKRWYDIDPTVSLAVSLIKNSDESKQKECAAFIIKKLKKLNIKKTDKFVVFRVFEQRWYDEIEEVYNAFEYLRNADLKTQKEVSVEIINNLYYSFNE